MEQDSQTPRAHLQAQSLQPWVLLAYAISLPLSMTVSWALLTAGLILWAAEAVVGKRPDQKKQTNSDPLLLPLIGFTIAVAISGLFNGTPTAGHFTVQGFAEALRSVWSLKAMLSYFWARSVFESDRKVALRCVQAVLIVGAAAGLWGTIQQIADFHPFGYHYLQGTGFLGGPMAFSGQMQIFSMLAVGLLLTGAYKTLGGKLSVWSVFALVTAANVLGLIFAGERSGWLGGIAGALVLTALLSFRTFAKCVLVLVFCGGLAWFSVPLVHTRVAAMLSAKQDVSTQVRLRVWDRALTEFQRSPVMGIGFLKFPHLDIPEAIVPGKSKDLNHAHSNYLQILSTTGVIGIAAYIWLCFAVLLSCYRLLLQARVNDDGLAVGVFGGMLAAMVSLTVAGMFEYNFGTSQVRLAQWFFLALLSLPIHRPVQAKAQQGLIPDALPDVTGRSSAVDQP